MGSLLTPRRGFSRRSILGRAAVEVLEERRLLATFYVDAASSAAVPDGMSWGTAYADLQLALGAALPGDTIRVAGGTYKPTALLDPTNPRTATFSLKNGVGIYGSYAGYNSANPDVQSTTLYTSILSGDIGIAGDISDNSYHVVVGSNTDSTAILDSVRIIGGNANGSSSLGYAGGGGMYNSSGSPTLNKCTFSGNTSTSRGGGMTNRSSSPRLTSCTFSGNTATGTSGTGGGMSNTSSSNPILTNCTFIDNVASVSGGGMSNTSLSMPSLTGCTFTRNSANIGGGMYNSGVSPWLTNCKFNGNTAFASGGGMYNSGSPTITNSTFVGNVASNTGGAAYNDAYSSPSLTNCTLAGNSAPSGGGMYNAYSTSNPTLTNCIVWGSGNAPIYNNASTPVITYSDIQGGYAGTGNINADPQFVRSPSSGVDGTWGTVDDDYGDPSLVNTSPAIDVGSNAAVSLSYDIAGRTRILNGVVDLGAYEGPYRVLYVDQNAPGANTGASWNDAYTSLQSALQAAVASDTICVADGVYQPTTGTDRTISFTLVNSVAIYGGYAGYGAADPSARNVAAYLSILSGDIGAWGDKSDNSFHVVTASGTNSSAILDGFWITGGNANSTSPYNVGGGMYNSGGSPTLTNCTFSGNTANRGGGMANTNSASPSLTNCRFIGNSAIGTGASAGGGGMSNSSSTPSLINCAFIGNVATNYGGGVYNTFTTTPTTTLTLTNCTFTANFAASGGAIFNSNNNLFITPTLTNCIIWNNGNAGIVNTYAPLIIRYSDIQGGYAGTGNINADPQFVRSPWPGFDWVFGTADDDFGDLHLSAGSPALDVGFNAAIPTRIATDLAGNVRIQNGTIDLGAYEGAIAVHKNIYVDLAAVGANTGTSWADAFPSLQSALLAAVSGDTIRIADGTYTPTTDADRSISFVLRNGVAIYGGYAGYGATDPNARDIVAYPTIFSGDIGVSGDSSDNSYHVLTASSAGSSTILDGVTVTGGNANGSGSNQSYGGGLFVTAGLPTLTNCTFSGNSASVNGGGIYLVSSSPTISNCTISGNSASDSGGGIYNSSSRPTLTNCTFSGNSANFGGGIYNLSSSPTVTNCTFTRNVARSGGGIMNFSSSPTLTNCTFSGNTAHYGGGIYNFNSSNPTVTNCIIWGSGITPIDNSVSTPVVTYSDIQGGFAGTGNINADPQFVRAPWTGPDGVFGTADDDTGDLRLRVGSPALDVGSNAAIPAGITTDIAGNARIQNFTVDLGAYEGPVTAPLARIIYVDQMAAGANNGVSWDNAFNRLRQAILSAVDGDTIRIAQGTFQSVISSRTTTYALRNGVAMYGGYAGCGASDPSARDIVAYPTIISGDIGISGDSSDNTYHVFTASGVGPSTVLDGVTVIGGNADGSGMNQSYYGGGLLVSGGSPTLMNCTFSGNSASEGGGIYLVSSSPTLTNCTFSGNSASNGGGMNNSTSSPSLINCTFIGNVANYGGGMFNSSSSPTISNCTFSKDSATNGGGISNNYSLPNLTNCTFSGNSASSGGAVFNENSSSPTLTNCTLSGNSADYGGGIYNIASSLTLTNCILWSNGGSPIDVQSGTPVITYSDIQGGFAGTGNIDADPRFVRAPWTGPDGVLGTADDDTGDLRLRVGSPALDVGSNAAIPAGITTDIAGNARIQNFTVDLGAYEGPVTAPLARIIYVDQKAAGANNGVSWDNAFNRLRQAILAAVDGDTIRIAQGTFMSMNSSRTTSYALRNGVAMYGGYAGCGASNPGARDIVAYPTIISGDIGVSGDSSDNTYHVLTSTGVGPSTVLDGVTVIGGNADGSGSNQSYGGGLLVTGGSPTLTNCTFSGNSAAGGGAIYLLTSSSTISNCTFSGNSASDGGGIFNESSAPTLTNCSFVTNSASDPSYGGGGMLNDYSSPTLTNCTFNGNTAYDGGGIFNESSAPTLTNCSFVTNSASDPSFGGGGMFNDYSSPTLTNCTFNSNTAQYAGGGMYNLSSSSPTLTNCTFSANTAYLGGGMYNRDSSSPTLTNCIFNGNSAQSNGGGMRNYSASATLIDCTFSGNTAQYGGAMADSSSSSTLANCIFNGNTAQSYGGGLFTYSSTAILANCTFSGNTGQFGGGMFDESSSSTLTNCVFRGNTVPNAGGGIFISSSSPSLTNCSFSGNTAAYGGAIGEEFSSPTLTNSTLSGNTATYAGGVMSDYASAPALTNCILWGNSAPSDPAIYQEAVSGPPTITYSDIQGGFVGTGNINADPKFVRNPSPGADGIWGTADDDYGDLRLRSTSPAIDAGNNAAVPAGVTTDLAGGLRLIDILSSPDTGYGTAPIVDMGAYETANPILPGWVDRTSAATWDAGTHTLTVTGAAKIIADPGSDSPSIVDGNAGSIEIAAGVTVTSIGSITGTGSLIVDAGASLTAKSIAQTSLTVNGTLALADKAHGGMQIVLGSVDGSGNTTTAGVLTIARDGSNNFTGKIDLADRLMMIHYIQDAVHPNLGDGPADYIDAALAQGRNVAPGGVFDGSWNGTGGIVSSTAAQQFAAAHAATGSPNTEFYAVGYGDTGKMTLPNGTITDKMLIDDAGSNFFDPSANGGRGAGVGSTVFVRYTRVGDVTMDGIVGNNDVTVLGLNFDPSYNPAGTSPRHWYDGNFNYNGVVENNDVTILGLQFDPSNTTAVPAVLQAATPRVSVGTSTVASPIKPVAPASKAASTTVTSAFSVVPIAGGVDNGGATGWDSRKATGTSLLQEAAGTILGGLFYEAAGKVWA